MESFRDSATSVWPPVGDADTHLLLRYAPAMRAQVAKLSILIIVLLAVSPVRAQESATRLITITVNDPTGAGVAHAQIRVVPAADSVPAKLETDSLGHLSLHLKPGSYALFVSAQGFKQASAAFDFASPKPGEVSFTQTVTVTLGLADVGSPVVYPAESLVLTAEGYHAPVVLSAAEFRALPHVTATVHNGHTDADETYGGVALATLLAMVNSPIGRELHGEALAAYVVATGTDGYSVVLALAEADPSFHGGEIVVADTRDGQPLGKSGPFQLIVSEDKRPARWVHNLDSIALRSAH